MRNLFVKLFSRMTGESVQDSNAIAQMTQRLLFQRWRRNLESCASSAGLSIENGFRLYSQADEDGLLLFIFSQIGFKSKKLVDMACGRPHGANATNLILNWGFHALLVDGNQSHIQECEAFYRNHPDSRLFPPRMINAWITAENINDLLRENDFNSEIDLLSLDVDGVDYWLWERLEAVSPRVVVVEYQDCFTSDKAVTVPYRHDFNRFDFHPDYFGASLGAFVKLGIAKGYRLVGCNRYGYNAFFVRNDVAGTLFADVDPANCLVHPKVREEMSRKRAILNQFPWQEV